MGTKEKVLSFLEQQRGIPVSGEAVAEQLGLSRNAVWKAVQTLRSQGYGISAESGRGYALSRGNDILSPEGIWASGSEITKSISIHVYNTLESTSQTAKALALEGASHGTAVFCNTQTAGRGRYSRSFSSPAGRGLYMSVILRPESLQTPDEPARVTIHAALSVCEAIETLTGLSPKIKWVNDILLDRKKICGILTEGITDYESGGIGWLVVGIGVNVSAQTEDFPPELREKVTSLYPDGKAQLTRNRLAGEILSRLLTVRDWDETLEGYKSRLMMLGETVTILRGEERFSALAEGVTPNGHLLVRRESGAVEMLSSGEISIALSP